MMSFSKYFIIGLLFGAVSFAEETPSQSVSEAFRPGIYRGNILAGGSVTLKYQAHSQSASGNAPQIFTFGINAPLQYFIIDRLAIGGIFSYAHKITSQAITSENNNTFNALGLGPAATYFFWTKDRLSSFVGLSTLINYDDQRRSAFWQIHADLGLDYFLTPSVAIGPSLAFNHIFKNDISQPVSITNLSLVFNFSIFL